MASTELFNVKAYKLGGRIGDARRLVLSVQKNIEKYHVSLEEACDGCGSSVDEYEAAQALLKKNECLDFED